MKPVGTCTFEYRKCVENISNSKNSSYMFFCNYGEYDEQTIFTHQFS